MHVLGGGRGRVHDRLAYSPPGLNCKGDLGVSTHTAFTLPKQFVVDHGIRFAYRRWGKGGGLPLVFLNYFTGNLDDWDPAVTDGIAADHDIILFNNAGVASSGGESPGTVEEMTRD